MTEQRGVALILAILLISFLTAIGLGLSMMVVMDRLASGNTRGSVAMLYIADAALEMAARDLAQVGDWDLVLTGAVRSRFLDGEPFGVRAIPGGGSVSLEAETNELNCGRSTNCSDAQMSANTRERPWGHNNPRWKLFAYGPVGNIAQLARPAPCYLAVWAADDGRERDGDALRDGGADEPGHGVLRVRAVAYGPFGARRAIEAELARICLDASETCRQGIRVQSWQEVRQSVP